MEIYQPDYVDLSRDQAANRLEALEGTVIAAGDGGVVHYGTIEAVAQEFVFDSSQTCSGSSCTNTSSMTSDLVPVTFHTSVREQNDGQTYRNVTGSGAVCWRCRRRIPRRGPPRPRSR